MKQASYILLTLILLLVACTTANDPVPTSVSESRLRDSDFPKELVTIAFTATPTPMTNTLVPTATVMGTSVAPPDNFVQAADDNGDEVAMATTPTVYVGVFIGEPTVTGLDGELDNGSAPLVIGTVNANVAVATPPAIVGDANCVIPIADAFISAYQTNPSLAAFGCPQAPSVQTNLVTQAFENGRMFWRDTRQITILSNSGTYWRVPDNWFEGVPERDEALVPPDGLEQPIRGFGLAWRENPTFQTTLGWARGPEFGLQSIWQEFDNGSLFIGDNNQIYAVPRGETGQYLGGIAQ